MKEKIKQIREDAMKQIEELKDLSKLNELKIKYLGKKGELTALLRGMGALSPEERPIIGSLVNEVRDKLENIIKTK